MRGVHQVLSHGVRVEIRRSVGKAGLYGDIWEVRDKAITVRVLDRTDQAASLRAGMVVSVIANCLKETLVMQSRVLADDGVSITLRLPQRIEVVRRRRAYRKRTTLRARYNVSGESSEARSGVVTDLSLGGMQLETDCELAVGQRLRIEFSLPDAERPIKVAAEVVRIVPHGPQGFGPKPRVGIRFAEVGRLDLPLLRAFVEGDSQSKAGPSDQAQAGDKAA